jgi:hypothetical protein
MLNVSCIYYNFDRWTFLQNKMLVVILFKQKKIINYSKIKLEKNRIN